MRKIFTLMVFLLTLSALIFGTTSCKSEEDKIRDYADPATETTLKGLSENSLEKYTQYGNDAFKAALTQELFDATTSQINSQLGAYKSKEFLSYEEEEGYIIVHYNAKFEKTDVGIRMVFDENHLIAGQWFE